MVSSLFFQKISGEGLTKPAPPFFWALPSILGCALNSGFAVDSWVLCALDLGFALNFGLGILV